MLTAWLMAISAHATLLWDGNATNGPGVFKLLDLEDENEAAQSNPSTNGSAVTTVTDPLYGPVWQFYKAVNDLRCEAHGASPITPAIGSTYYIGWRSKLTMPSSATLNAVFQWKAYGSPLLQNFPITIDPVDGSLTLNEFNPANAGGQTVLWTNALVTGVWIQHVLLIYVSDQDYGGYIEYWHNGEPETFTTGTNQFFCRTFDGTSVDPKWGAYGGDIYAITNQVCGLKIGTTYADAVDTLYCQSATPASQTTGLSGTNVSYTLTVATNAGFSGTIQLSVSGLPANSSYTISPSSFTAAGTATLDVTTSNTTLPGDYILVLRAISGGLTNYTTVGLNVAKAPVAYAWNGPGAGANRWSTPGNWSPAGPPTAIDTAGFNNAGAAGLAVSNLNNEVDAAFGGPIAALQYGNTNGNHTTLIAAGQILNINGDGGLLVGTETDNGNAQTVDATVTGAGGTLSLNDPNANLTVRQGSASSGGSQRATLDLSGLDTVNLIAGRVLVGVVGLVPRATGTLYLGKTNTLATVGATPQLCVGDNNGNGGGADYLYLGQTNAIFADTLTIGREKAAGTLEFNRRLASPTAYFRGADGVSPVTTWNIADNSAQSTSSSSSSGTCDFSLGTVNALVGTLNVGLGQTATGAGASGVLTFSNGLFNVNNLQIGVQSASGATSPGVGRVNVIGTNALLVVNASLTLGQTSGSAGTTNTYGTLNLNGGTVLANAILAGSGSGSNAIVINHGLLVVTNTIGTTTAAINTVALTNATLQCFVTSGQPWLVATNLTTGGPASLINLASLPAIASYPAQFQLLKYSGGIGGAGYNFTLGTLPAGTTTYAGYLSNHLAAYSVDLVITGPAKPPELHVNLAGTNLVITGTSPLAGVKYYVLGSTNFQRPRPDWTILATNYFNLAGNLAFTNPISPASPQQFYQLQIP